MIRKIYFILWIVLFHLDGQSQDFKEIELKTSIESVKVFTQGAQITRTGKITLPAGKSSLILKSLSPYINENSIQAKGLGNFTLLSVSHRYNYLGEQKKDATIDSLKVILQDLDARINKQTTIREAMESKKKMLEENRKIAGTQTGITYDQLNKIADYYMNELMNIGDVQYKANIKQKELQEEKDKIQGQLNQLTQQNIAPSGEIVVRVDSKSGGRSELTIDYFTQNAGWVPKYDIRAIDIASPIQLGFKADVYQNTKEDWDQVKLILSTGNPNQGGIAPQLSTWYLNFQRAMNTMARSARKFDDSKMAYEMATPSQAFGSGSGDAEVLEEAATPQAKVSPGQTTIEIEVAEPYSIRSSGEQLTVNLQDYKVDALYEYYAVPKLDKDAFLIAKIINWNQYNLLPGEANLFFEGTYVGKTFLNTDEVNDTLEVSLGRDQSIVIQREKETIYSKASFIGPNKVETRSFKLSVRNKKSVPIKLSLFDQVPVSTISDITVTPVDLSGGQLNATTGEVTWKFDISAGGQKELNLKYEVKYPKKERVILE